jgi:hypothetical protein
VIQVIVRSCKGDLYDVVAFEYKKNEGIFGTLPHGKEILLSEEQWDEKKEKSLAQAELQKICFKLAELGELIHDFGNTSDDELRKVIQDRRGEKSK